MRRVLATLLLALSAAVLLAPGPALGAFSFKPGHEGLSVSVQAEGGAAETRQAHTPTRSPTLSASRDGDSPRDLHLDLPAGMLEDPAVLPTCSAAAFHTPRTSPLKQASRGRAARRTPRWGRSKSTPAPRSAASASLTSPPPLECPMRSVPPRTGPHFSSLHPLRRTEGTYALTLGAQNLPQSLSLAGMRLTIWGLPWGVSHNTNAATA